MLKIKILEYQYQLSHIVNEINFHKQSSRLFFINQFNFISSKKFFLFLHTEESYKSTVKILFNDEV